MTKAAHTPNVNNDDDAARKCSNPSSAETSARNIKKAPNDGGGDSRRPMGVGIEELVSCDITING